MFRGSPSISLSLQQVKYKKRSQSQGFYINEDSGCVKNEIYISADQSYHDILVSSAINTFL